MIVLNYIDILDRIQSISKRLPEAVYSAIGSTGAHSPDYEMAMMTLGRGPRQVCLAAGTHGDEPAGVEGVVRFLEKLADGEWERRLDLRSTTLTILPCNNPSGLERKTRENTSGIDLNRRFGSQEIPSEVAAIQMALAGKTFDLFADFHEDTDGEGFYLYEIFRPNRDARAIGQDIVNLLSQRWNPDRREEIDGFENRHGVIRPEIPRTPPLQGVGLPLPVYLYFLGAGHCITLETPTSVPFEDRVQMHLLGLEAILTRTGVMV
ncbi:MAG: M14 family metallocarboxypeptidase [Nitrospirae bacterium]|nr:M14 family metallocarboxypeptidase [Nitrospirota bacterium]